MVEKNAKEKQTTGVKTVRVDIIQKKFFNWRKETSALN